jgi:hypothetical protein
VSVQPAIIDYLITNQPILINTDVIRELWMIPDRMTASYQTGNDGVSGFVIRTFSPLYVGKLFVREDEPGTFYKVTEFTKVYTPGVVENVYHVWGDPTGITYDPNVAQALCKPQDSFMLQPGQIDNFKGSEPVDTTVGIFVANYLLLVYPFGDKIAYLNEEITAAKLEKRIATLLLTGEITTRDVKDKYINTLSLFGQSNEIVCANISEKTITIPQSIHDLRTKLVAEHKEALEAGDASVMSDIEKQLITAYRNYLKGDPSLHFLLKAKYFNVTLKKLFLVQGMTEVFGSPGKFTFVDNPMGKGWNQKDLPVIFNEVRSGSYSRAVETANGGVIAKLILRVLQDTTISIPDCGTTKGESVEGNLETLKDFIYNYTTDDQGHTTLITDENVASFVGSKVVIRTPGYCKSDNGFCAKCFGYLFESLGQKAFAPVANDFARNQTTASLKSMHGKSHSTVDVSDLNRYLVGA